MGSHRPMSGSERWNRPNRLRLLAGTKARCRLRTGGRGPMRADPFSWATLARTKSMPAPIRFKEKQASLPKRTIGLAGGAIAYLLALSIVGAILVSAEADSPRVGFAWTRQFGTPS